MGWFRCVLYVMDFTVFVSSLGTMCRSPQFTGSPGACSCSPGYVTVPNNMNTFLASETFYDRYKIVDITFMISFDFICISFLLYLMSKTVGVPTDHTVIMNI
jgi:hypothetical protein